MALCRGKERNLIWKTVILGAHVRNHKDAANGTLLTCREEWKGTELLPLAGRNEHFHLPLSGVAMEAWPSSSGREQTECPGEPTLPSGWGNQASEFSLMLWQSSLKSFSRLAAPANICIFANIPGPKTNVTFAIREQQSLSNRTYISGFQQAGTGAV